MQITFIPLRNSIFSIVFLASILTSCDKVEPSTVQLFNDELIGDASPFRLNFENSILNLEDYFPNPKGISAAVLCGDSLAIDTVSWTIEVTNSTCNPVDVLNITYNLAEYAIPVFASEKQGFEFKYKPSTPDIKSVSLAGNFNGWNPSATPLQKSGDEFTCSLVLDPAVYQYQVVEDGEWKLDVNNPEKMDNGQGAFNSVFKVGDSSVPGKCWLDRLDGSRVFIGNPDNLNLLAFYCDRSLEIKKSEDGEVYLEIPEEQANSKPSSSIRIYSYSESKRCNDLLIPLQGSEVVLEPSKINRSDIQGNVMYFAMVDRFVDGDSTNNHPTPDPTIRPKANHFGGDLKGITQEVKSGYFDSLGVNCLWISPITQNPEGAYGLWDKGITSTFSAYHGYWPISSSEVDYRFGSSEDLTEMIDALHADNMNIFLDYVANHVHEEHPIYQNHPDWATDLYLPDGSLNTERWDEHRLTTWFDKFLPTLDLSRAEVVEPLTDSAMFWIENFELDGFRHDATKHIPELFWRTLTKKMKAVLGTEESRNLFQIGETYGNSELIASYIGSGMLDSQFDFNLYDAAVDAFAKDETDFKNLQRVLNESLHAYGGHHLMGNITGNQDRARFLSYADGTVKFDEDPKLAGWIRDIQRNGDLGFKKMQLLTSFLMSVPGIPCIYYGDEIGMPGANDPDNRRMMYFDNWSAGEKSTFDNARSWINFRRNSMAMMYGETQILKSSGNSLVILRRYFDEVAINIFYKGNDPATIEIELDSSLDINSLKGLTGQNFQLDKGKITIQMQAWDSACLISQ